MLRNTLCGSGLRYWGTGKLDQVTEHAGFGNRRGKLRGQAHIRQNPGVPVVR
jgi:hypothetical protein